MNKTDLIAATAQRSGATQKDTALILETALDTIVAALAAGEKVQLTGFGTFDTKERAQRTGRNLHTGALTQIPATTVAAFTPSQRLKDAVAHKE
ncbi:MAG: HU family DNA-binding protein [Oscillospiraceae bacterium]|nr:HU family DNA-binding protein [Oscillospiraceae bacterium]